MNRRDILRGAGAVPALAVPVTAQPAVMALYRRWVEIHAAATAYVYNPAHVELDDATLNRLFYDDLYAVEDEMLATPSVTAQDMAAKMLVAHCHGEMTCLDYDKNPVWVEARALIQG